MKTLGKISRLPVLIREQLNERLRQNEEGNLLVAWLNSLPEVISLVATEFAGHSISKQNLSQWRQHGYRDWLLRRTAFDFAQPPAPGTAEPHPPSSARLADWVTLHYAAVARSLDFMDTRNPEVAFRRIRKLCSDVTAIRRNEIREGFLALHHQRLALHFSQL